MYSGLVLTKYSGRVMGAHQKIDRVARRHLGELLPLGAAYPGVGGILQFEGKNGPDGVKRKSPARDEPWHYIDPLSDDHDAFLAIINKHYNELVIHLKKGNQERAAFESAWLAHAVVDGLTPAHHYPYEEKMTELRAGKSKETRTTISEKLIFKGDTASKTIFNTYKAYGPRGLLTAHVLFELGVMILIRPLRLPDARPTEAEISEVLTTDLDTFFMRRAREIAVLDLFETYIKSGWTTRLSNQIRHQLAPTIVKSVTLLWYKAATEAGLCVP